MNKEKFDRALSNGISSMFSSSEKIKLNSEIQKKLWIYLNFLVEENKKYNLTALNSSGDILTKHFLDSISSVKLLNFEKRKKVIDVGTGAGFPGMVLKIFYPEIDLVLLDSLQKRTIFLTKLAYKLKLTKNVEIIHDRAENFGKVKKYREKFDYVLSRAVTSMNVLAEYTLPLNSIGGECIFYKGPEYKKELKNAKNSIEKLGGVIKKEKKVEIPFLNAERYLIVIKKERKTPEKYPRRSGIPEKRPL